MKTTRRDFIGEGLGFAALTGLDARSTDGSAPGVAFAVS